MAEYTCSFALWLRCSKHNGVMHSSQEARTMSTDLYAKYIQEREGREILTVEHGFLTYKRLDKDTYYLIDCFVEKGYRKLGIARQLGDDVCAIAKQNGAIKVLGSVCLDAAGVTESLTAILAAGYRYSSIHGNTLYFTKDL